MINKFFFLILIFTANALGQTTMQQPHIGYLYPAGGQRGTTFQIIAGGQLLNGANDVFISGKGIEAKVIKVIKPLGNIKAEERQLLVQNLAEVRNKRLIESGADINILEQNKPAKKFFDKPLKQKKDDDPNRPNAAKKLIVKMPDHYLLDDLENKSLRELTNISEILFFPKNKKQMNRQISETALIEITIDPNAELGDRELRILTRQGLTNPMVFQLGSYREVKELEPNNKQAYPDIFQTLKIPNRLGDIKLPKEKALTLPIVLNGQIYPGDVDRFRFAASQGQNLVIQTYARSLIPYMADAVPGWFQATVSLYDSKNKEVAFGDDYRFNPDPVLMYRIPQSGEYEIEIHDSVYRGREDFVYRISIGQSPFITQMFPLGAEIGKKTTASIQGWNLPVSQLNLNTTPGYKYIRQTAYRTKKQVSNLVSYAVDTLPQCFENEPNNGSNAGQQISLPIIIDGIIDKPGDSDTFKFAAKAGDQIIAKVYGRHLNSPIDSLLKLTDEKGKQLAFNDDYIVKDENYLYKDAAGLITHPCDSYLAFKLPKDGTYFVNLSDSQNHGGKEYGYRLAIYEAVGDFALKVTPSSLYALAGNTVPIDVYVSREDGFDGPIDIEFKDASGFILSGGQIEAGCDHKRMTVTMPLDAPAEPFNLTLIGKAKIGGKIVSRNAIPAEDMMQAFLYRHLVPSEQLLVFVKADKWRSAKRNPVFELTSDVPVRIPVAGSVTVHVKNARGKTSNKIELQLDQPPQGLTVGNVTLVPDGFEFKLKADKNLKVGFKDNIIVKPFAEILPNPKQKMPQNKIQRNQMGLLPAIPIEIIEQ